jgi:uncharacterized protein YjbI with pentapeptide repeats
MDFTGKWSIKAKDTGSEYVSLADAASGNLSIVQADTPGEMQFFNTYEDDAAPGMFWLQAFNGKYLTFSDDGYTAALARDAQPVYFSCEDAGNGWVRIVDHGPDGTAADLYYWNRQDGNLERIQKNSSPPDSTLFQKNQETPGLKDIQGSQSAKNYNLNWVYMAGANFTKVTFSNCQMKHVDLTNAIFSTCQMDHVDLSYALMPGVSIVSTSLKEANFYKATLTNYAIISNSDLDETDFSEADLTGATLGPLDFKEAMMVNTKFIKATVANCDFTGANLTNADFTRALLSYLNICGTNFTGAILNKQNFTTSKIDENTNFKGAKMQQIVLSGCKLDGITFTNADMTGAILDGVSLKNAEMSYVNLTGATLKGGVILTGASLSNATLSGVDLTGAQLGAKTEAFVLDSSFQADLDRGIIPGALKQAFSQHGIPRSAASALTIRTAGQDWLITDNGKYYDIKKSDKGLIVYDYQSSANAAVLSSAYMPNAILTGANLYAVNMAGASWYGANAKADNADLEEADFANANLATMNLTQANMYGCTLDFANLVNTKLPGAILTPAANLKQASFVGASLQGADFTDAQLADAVLTNAAVSLEGSGVPLFELDTSFSTDLDNKNISDDLSKVFTENGYELLDAASVNVITQGQQWIIDNNSSDPNQLHPGYAEFVIIKQTDNTNISWLQVYGSSLWIVRTGDNHKMEQIQVAFGPTKLTPDVMNENTTGPCGQRLKMFQKQYITWEQFMTANIPPAPPECIPSPTRWCP